MPYKVIQTLEKGKPVLTAVPHAWERDGTLFWPKYNAEKLLKLENTYPEGNWITIPCVVKRYNIHNYENAEIEIRSMMYQNDMEAGDEQNSNKRQTAVLATFNELAKQCILMSAPGDAATAERNNETNIMPDKLYILNDSPYKQTPALTSTSGQVLENQRKIIENQQKIMRKLAEFSVQLDQLIAKSNNPIQSDSTMEHNSTFSVIDSINALEKFENDLQDVNKRSIIYKKYSIVCKGKGVGLNCAYVLIDILFSRKFLTKCSWAGGSRGEISKIALKTYKNTINFFYNLIHDCDQTFSLMDCYAFLKNILKNSIKRNESKGLRTSSCKHRPRKKQNTRTQNNTPANKKACGDEEDEENLYNMVEYQSPRASSSKLTPKKKRNARTSESESDTEKESVKEEDEEEIRNKQILIPKPMKIKTETLDVELNIEGQQGINETDDKEDLCSSE